MRSVVSWIPSEAEPEKEIFLRMLLESAPREEKGRKKQEWAEGEGRLTGNWLVSLGASGNHLRRAGFCFHLAHSGSSTIPRMYLRFFTNWLNQ